MSDIIRLLPDSVANQIAAGEVIQRPASVIKELVENAVDAGATEIQVIIKDAGRTLIQVIDNGKGMTETDARMAFERHATSKIDKAADLFALHTMGFRGEALPSICAISQVELRTRTPDDRIGVRLCLNASKVEIQEACVTDAGANFMVKNIFFNVPARRKFLKSDTVELANIMREFERLALVNCGIRMSISTGKRTTVYPPGNFKQRISDIWKNNLNLQLLPVEVDTSLVRISGYISRPENARKRNPLQFLIVNGRNMKHPYFHKAVMNCYEHLIAPGEQPCYFLRFEVDPSTIDVNIHPTKNEIKFENEKEIWPILAGAVRASLGKYSAVPSIDFSSDVLQVDPLMPGEKVDAPELPLPADYNPFEMNSEAPSRHRPVSDAWRPSRTSRQWESLYSDFMTAPEADAPEESVQMPLPDMPAEESVRAASCLQWESRYIITQLSEGLAVVDQHRAHERVLYEDFMGAFRGESHPTQRVLFPQPLALDEAQSLTLEGVEDDLTHLGFMLSRSDSGIWSVEGVPPEVEGLDPTDLLMRIIEATGDDTVNYGNESPVEAVRRELVKAIAKNAAIRRGTRLTDRDMEHLLSRLFSLPDPAYTAGGLTIFTIIPISKIDSLLAIR